MRTFGCATSCFLSNAAEVVVKAGSKGKEAFRRPLRSSETFQIGQLR